MPIKFSEKFHISGESIEQTGVFDVILDVDTRFFIDPALLKLCDIPEFTNAHEKVTNYFSNIIHLLQGSTKENDLCWKAADKLLTFHELTGTCLGYSKTGTSGNAIGPVLRLNILRTIKIILGLGENDPVLFELLGVFQEKMGCDRISDLVTYILREEIHKYTTRICVEYGIDDIDVYLGKNTYHTCKNPYNQKPLLLLPKAILSPLPVAEGFDDINTICHENYRVREEINKYFDFGNRTKFNKDEILKMLHSIKLFRQTFVNGYKNYPVNSYDFSDDPSGEYVWYDAAKTYMQQFPLDITSFSLTSITDVFTIAQKICMHFKSLVEDNGLSALLFDSNGVPKKESAAQLLFFGIASFCCTTNNVDLTREGNNGRGPVDFKLSRGSLDKVLVEVKLTSNSQLKHGIEKQLPVYMAQENTKKAIYLIIDTGHPKTFKNFEDFYHNLSDDIKNKITYYVIDATPKLSASRA